MASLSAQGPGNGILLCQTIYRNKLYNFFYHNFICPIVQCDSDCESVLFIISKSLPVVVLGGTVVVVGDIVVVTGVVVTVRNMLSLNRD